MHPTCRSQAASMPFGPRNIDRPGAWRSVVMGLLSSLFLAIAAPVVATPEYILPTLFDVTDVASNDVLNIRAAPGATAPIIGTLAHDARDIEVVGYDATGRWARVNAGEQSGWVALRYLAYQVDIWTTGTLPPTLQCFGNEPFWSVGPRAGGVVLSRAGMPDAVMQIEDILDTGLFRDPRRYVMAQGAGLQMAAVMLPVAFSDGMSDRAYGLDVTMILRGRESVEMLTGCCSIAPQ